MTRVTNRTLTTSFSFRAELTLLATLLKWQQANNLSPRSRSELVNKSLQMLAQVPEVSEFLVTDSTEAAQLLAQLCPTGELPRIHVTKPLNHGHGQPSPSPSSPVGVDERLVEKIQLAIQKQNDLPACSFRLDAHSDNDNDEKN